MCSFAVLASVAVTLGLCSWAVQENEDLTDAIGDLAGSLTSISNYMVEDVGGMRAICCQCCH